jgi:hypothetical protein
MLPGVDGSRACACAVLPGGIRVTWENEDEVVVAYSDELTLVGASEHVQQQL